MPDPLAFTDPLATPRSVVGSMIAPEAKPADAVAFNPTSGRYLVPAKFNRDGSPAPKVATGPEVAADSAAGAANIASRENAAKPADVMGTYFHGLRKRESGGNDMAVNTTTGATGRYQFLPSTWAGVIAKHSELGLTEQDIYNGDKQEAAIHAFTNDNIQILKSQGLPVDPGSLYAMHFLGSGAGPQFMKAVATNPSANAAAMFPAAARANPTVFYANGQPLTAGQVHSQMAASFGGPKGASTDPLMADTPMAFKQEAQDAFSGTQLPQTLDTAKTSLEEVKLPPPPRGVKLDATFKMPPPPRGVKLDYNSKEPMKSDNPYAVGTPPAKTVTPKTPQNTSGIVGTDPISGGPIYNDPGDQRETAKAEAEGVKGFAAGLAQDVTGPASLLPPLPGTPKEVSGAAERLNTDLADVGNDAARKVGNIAGMIAPGGAAVEAIDEGKAAFAAGKSLWPSIGKGVVSGSATGVLAESSNPSGKDTYGEQIAAKAPGMAWAALEGGAAGGLFPVGIASLGGAAKWVGGKFADVFGRDVAKSVEELITGLSSITGKELTKEEIAAREATLSEVAEKKVIEDHAQRKSIPPEQAGADLQPVIQADRKTVMDKRRSESGFADAVKSDGGRPSIKTKDAASKIADIEKRFDVDLRDLKSTLRTRPDVKGGEVQQAVSIERGRHFVDVLNDKIEEAKPGPAHTLTDIRDDFIEHMETTHPKLKEAREKYRDLSRDVDPYERKGVLVKPSESDLYSKEPTMDPTKVVALLTNKTAQSGASIKRLVDGDKTGKVKETIEQHFNYELWGGGKTPDVARMDKLLADRRIALENSGLYKDFEKLRNERAAFEDPAKVRAAAEKAQHDIKDVRQDLAIAAGPKGQPNDVVVASKKALNLLDRYPPRISSEQVEQLKDGIKDLENNIKDRDRARKLAFIVGGALAAGTVGGEQYISHRVGYMK